MDPCQFVQIVIGNLAIRFPSTSDPGSKPGCYCKIRFSDFPHQSAVVPVIPQDANHPDGSVQTLSACFNLTKTDVDRLARPAAKGSRRPMLKIDVYSGGGGAKGCGFGWSGKLVGRVAVPVELSQQEGNKVRVMQNGWVLVGERKKKGLNPQLYLSVKAQPDPRFVFEFDGEPECSPQVFQVQGNIRQPVFTCKFSFRHSGDRNLGSCSTMSETSTSRSWLSSLKADKARQRPAQVKERKGWSITIHDLSGSPVAAASMVTPFVPSQGSDRVSRSNPGAWLILRPGDGTWKPWGRLEAWRDSSSDGLGYRFELLPDAGVMGSAGITLTQASVPTRPGGKFTIDITTGTSPAGSPNSSFDFASWTGSGSGSSTTSSGSETGWWPGLMYKGFVMSSTVGGEGRVSKPVVEVGSQHVTCTEDAAAFVALSAAVDLSMDACRPFSHKLRKELRQQSEEFVV